MTARYNLGCGDDVRDGYVNVDLRKAPGVVTGGAGQPDYLIQQFGDPEEVLMLDVLEHFSWREADQVLTRWCDALVPGGTIHVRVPNLERFAKTLIHGSGSLDKIRSDIFGGQDYPENTHRTFFTIERLTEIMGNSSVEVVEVQKRRNLNVRGKRNA